MGISEIAANAATEQLVKTLAERIRKEIEANAGKPEVVSALQKVGRFALRQLENRDSKWVKEYELVFSVTMPGGLNVEANLEMAPDEFFQPARFYHVGASQRTTTSAIKGLKWLSTHELSGKGLPPAASMREFLQRNPERYMFTRVLGMGRKSVDAAIAVLRAAHMPFNYPD